MRSIVGWSLKARFIVLALAVGMMVFGAREVQKAPMDVFPEFAPPRVEIQTLAIGLSAVEVEQLVTVPLEEQLNGVDDLKTIRSKSVRDLSQIEMIFERGTDLHFARQQVSERLVAVTPTLPTWASPPYLMQPLSATSRAMKIGLETTDPEITQEELSMISYWNIKPRLLAVNGVANVQIYGEQIDMFQVQMDPILMKEHGVTIDEIMETTADSLDSGLLQYSDGGFIGTGGFVETPNQRLSVRHISPILGPEDLTNLPIKGHEDEGLTLGDVTQLVRGHQPLIGDAVVNDGRGIMLIVEKLPWANNVDISKGVDEAMKDLEPGLQGIAYDTTIFRPATFIETSIHNLTEAMIIAAVLVILVLILFLFDWRTALISVVAIPLSLMAAAVVLLYMGTTINVMVLAGLVIAIGVVVDDAIIDVENIWRRLREARIVGDTRSTSRIVLDASLEVRSSIIHATFLDVIVLLPVFTMVGLSGAFFKPLATSYILAVMASLVVAITVTPAMAYLLLRNAKLEKREPIFLRIMHKIYVGMLTPVVKNPSTAYLSVAVVALTGFMIVPGFGSNLLPEFKERDFLMHWLTKPGTSQEEEFRISVAACNELREIPGVRNCASHIGQAFQSDEPYGVDFGENWISVDPSVSYNETLAAIQETVDGYPGLRRDVQTYLKERIREVLAGSSHPIIIRIYGDDLTVIREKGEEIKKMLEEIEGVTEEHVESLGTPTPQIEVEVNLAAAEKYGVKPGDVRRMVGIVVAGEEAGDMFVYGRTHDINVWSVPDARHSVEDIGNMLIDTPSGEKIQLKEVAEVRIAETPNGIKHENQSRRIDVDANVEGRSLSAVVADIEERMEDIEFPVGYHAEILGEDAERKDAFSQLAKWGFVSLIGVFFILYAAFGSWRLAWLSFLTLPSALVGGVLAVYFFNDSIISLGSLVGFLTVFGIAARNKIMLIAHYQHLEKEEGVPWGKDLIIRGAMERFSPIMMTALATGLALVPLAVAGDIPGHEVEHPMAVVILGGLITSTLLNLFIVPVLYMHFGKSWNLRLLNRRGSTQA